MRYSLALVLAVGLGFAACSSESTNEGNGGGGSAGSGTGGTGTGGTAETGGVAGQSGSAGSVSGGGTGGSSGKAGTDAGKADASLDADAGLASTVKCGASAPKCPTQPGRCCFDVDTKTPVCQVGSAVCSWEDNSRIECDGSEDCPSGQVCCSSTSLMVVGDSGIKPPSVTCASSCKSEAGAVRLQVCDVSKTSPTQCLVGSCKKVVHSSPQTGEALVTSLPLGYGVCG